MTRDKEDPEPSEFHGFWSRNKQISRLSAKYFTNSWAECANRKLQTKFCAFQTLLSVQKFSNFEYFHLILSISLHKIPKEIIIVEFCIFLKPRQASSSHIILKEISRKEFCVICSIFLTNCKLLIWK